MDNGTENMLDMYLFETNTLLERLDELLIEDEKEGTFSTDDVNEIFRIMHTIKGSSAMMEFPSIMTVAHRIEDMFFFIRENGMDAVKEEYRRDLFDLMFRSTDYIRDEVSKLEEGEELNNDIEAVVSEISAMIAKLQGGETEVKREQKPAAKADGAKKEKNDEKDAGANGSVPEEIRELVKGDDSPFYLIVHFEAGCGMENLRAFMLTNSVSEVCQDFVFFPEDVENNTETAQDIIEAGFVMGFKTKEALDAAVDVVKTAGSIHAYEPVEVKKEEPAKEEKKEEMPKPKEESKAAPAPAQKAAQKPAANGGGGHSAAAAKQSLISVNLTKLDKLMAVVGEIVITESMVTSSPELKGLKLDNFTKSARQLRKLTDELQDISMSIRMVSVSGVFQKMNRIVRDMCSKLGKDVKLTLIGADTEVDKTIVDSIGDPIMHIVRNSMDHGIEETAEERVAAGKSARGEIILSAEDTGNEVIISIQDDGRGADPEKILAKARRNGILTKPESEYSHREILSLLMAPGFSTNEQVTEYSGRGVGMDVVKKNIEAVGGTIVVTSEKGQGMTTTLKIPLTIAIVDGMELSVGKSIFTVPISNIRQSFKVTADEVIHDAKNGEMVKRLDDFYPIVRLHEIYGIETEITNIEDGILVWVENGDKSYCLFVDELLGEQQVVVKPFPAYLSSFDIKNYGIGGCTILGDGNISIILEVANINAAPMGMY